MLRILKTTQKLIRNNGILWGFLLLVLSLGVFLVPTDQKSGIVLGIFHGLFCLGIIMCCDYIDWKLTGKSLLINDGKVSFFHTFGIAAIVAAVILEITVDWLAKNWVFPYFNYISYAVLFIPGFIFYSLVIAESYFATKAILDRLWRRPKLIHVGSRKLKFTFTAIGVVSFLLLLYGYSSLVNIYLVRGSFFYSVDKPIEFTITYQFLFVIALGLWGILEFIGYLRGKNTLLKACFHGYWTPLVAIFMAAVWLGIAMEGLNAPVQFWTYLNLPDTHLQIFGVSLWVLIGWPLHYIPGLSLYKLISRKIAKDPWQLDSVKTPI